MDLQEKQVKNNYDVANKCLTNENYRTSSSAHRHHVSHNCFSDRKLWRRNLITLS